MGTGSPASNPRSAKGLLINCLACALARLKHRVGKALIAGLTAAMRASSTSSNSKGETAPLFSFETTSTAVI
jgi:hypothetical protein